jgi:hypothetical protein
LIHLNQESAEDSNVVLSLRCAEGAMWVSLVDRTLKVSASGSSAINVTINGKKGNFHSIFEEDILTGGFAVIVVDLSQAEILMKVINKAVGVFTIEPSKGWHLKKSYYTFDAKGSSAGIDKFTATCGLEWMK